MEITVLQITTIVLYLFTTSIQSVQLAKSRVFHRGWLFLFGGLALACHAWVLHLWIDIAGGQNLTLTTMFSLAAWQVALLLWLIMWFRSVDLLLLPVFPFTAFTIFLVMLFPGIRIINTSADPGQLIHILLAVITFSVVSIAGLQALLLAFLRWRLHHKQLGGVTAQLPPLETMETLLFQIIWLGYILLTIMIITSWYFFHHDMTTTVLQKTLLVLLSWLIFGLLLMGRYWLGWRGTKAIIGTLIGVVLLTLIYFGSVTLLGFAF